MKPGDLLGRYRIDTELGSGGMGVVYKAYDTMLRRTVAVKMLSSHNRSADPDRLLDEARIASALNHPNICTVHEVSEVKGQRFIVMEYIDGRPVTRTVPVLPLPVDTIIHYGTQIADALAHAHDQGVIHRDLKSTNVMATSAGRVKVLDFGLATYLETSEVEAITQSATALSVRPELEGSLPFMAPEVLRGERADVRSDIWSLGVVLYEMATGVLPFTGRTTFALTAAILQDSPGPLPARVPSSLVSVIMRCLSKQPGMRYQRAGEVLAALQAIRIGVSTEAVVGNPSQRSSRSSRRYAIVALVATCVVCVLIAAGWLLESRLNGPPGPAQPGTPPVATELGTDRIAIAEIAPANGTTMRRGSTVRIQATLRYEVFSADSATIAMVVQDSANPRYRLGSVPQPNAVVSRGKGSITLSDTVTIPMLAVPPEGISQVAVFFPLAQPGRSTSVVTTATYPVQ